MTMRHRFPILISNLGAFLLLPFGVSRRQAVIHLRDGKMRVEFGPMFDETFDLEAVEGVETASWPIWAGIGPRTNLRGAVGLVGAYRNIVRVRFKEPQRVRLFMVPVSCQRLYVSLEDPHGFTDALEQHLTRQVGASPEATAVQGTTA